MNEVQVLQSITPVAPTIQGIQAVFGKENITVENKEKVVMEAMKKAGKPVRPGDLAKSIDMDSKEVSKIIDSLKKKGMVVSPKRCFYAPSDS
jgi:DNA-binding MarR family transcriptional regulator